MGNSNMVANVNSEVISSMLNTMNTMQQTVMGLQQTVLKLMSDKSENNKPSENSLDAANAALKQHTQTGLERSPGGYRLPQSEFGIPSECITHLDIVGEKIKKEDLGRERRQSSRIAYP
jgi:hypothetical protein